MGGGGIKEFKEPLSKRELTGKGNKLNKHKQKREFRSLGLSSFPLLGGWWGEGGGGRVGGGWVGRLLFEGKTPWKTP